MAFEFSTRPESGGQTFQLRSRWNFMSGSGSETLTSRRASASEGPARRGHVCPSEAALVMLLLEAGSMKARFRCRARLSVGPTRQLVKERKKENLRSNVWHYSFGLEKVI